MANNEPREDVAADGAARSVQGAGRGLVKLAVGTSGQVFDLRKYAGRYVKITPKGNGIYYGFLGGTGPAGEKGVAPAASALDATIDSKTVAQPATFSSPTDDETEGVPDYTTDGVPVHEVVPKSRPFLVVKTVSAATADIRVRPS